MALIVPTHVGVNRQLPSLIKHGFSKDKRPDLKQPIHSLLCVDDGIPIYTKCEDGNASDKVIDKNLIRWMVERMKELGHDNFVYNGSRK